MSKLPNTLRYPIRQLLLMSFVALSVAFATPASAATTSLEDVLALAYMSNPQLEAQRAKVRATDEEVAKALAGWRPTVTANGSYGWRQGTQSGLGNVPSQAFPQSEQVSVSQPVFNGQTIPNIRRAKAEVDAARAVLLISEQTTLLAAATAYFDVLRDTQIVALHRGDVIRLRSFLRNTEERLRLGELTKTDVSLAAARLAGTQIALATAEQQLAKSRADFEHVVGRLPEELIPHPVAQIPSTEEVVLQIALHDNPGILQSQAETRAADYAVTSARLALLPTISIQTQYGRTIDQIAPGVKSSGLSVLGQVSIPLYQGGSEEAAIRQASEQRAQATFGIAEADRQVREDVRNAWQALETSEESATLAAEQAKHNRTAYEGSKLEVLVGSRTTLDILNADQELVQSEITALTSDISSKIASYQVLAAMGHLTAKDLMLKVTLYDPGEYYKSHSTRWLDLGD